MRYINGIFRIGFVLCFALAVGACHQKDIGEEDAKAFNRIIIETALLRAIACSQPTSIRLELGWCPSQKLDSGLIYDALTSNPISASSVGFGTQLECRGRGGALQEGNGWYKSLVEPMPPGYAPVFIQAQGVNKDANGNVVSYQPFTNYSAGDLLVCVTALDYGDDLPSAYQVVKIN